jgi:formate dehydrogenase maturation protein FdhE
MIKLEWYKNKVAWCPICSQGWVEIVKDVETKELYVMCDECENEWNHPEKVEVSKAKTETNDNRVMKPTDEEIRSANWEKYIINE